MYVGIQSGRLPQKMADKLGEWLGDSYTHPELTYWLYCCINLQGTHQLSNFHQLSSEMRRVTENQDFIWWKDFMKGKLYKDVFGLQRLSII